VTLATHSPGRCCMLKRRAGTRTRASGGCTSLHYGERSIRRDWPGSREAGRTRSRAADVLYLHHGEQGVFIWSQSDHHGRPRDPTRRLGRRRGGRYGEYEPRPVLCQSSTIWYPYGRSDSRRWHDEGWAIGPTRRRAHGHVCRALRRFILTLSSVCLGYYFHLLSGFIIFAARVSIFGRRRISDFHA
jgi:hypothetical protein